MTFLDHFSERAKQYAKHRPRYPAEIFNYLASIAPAKELAWDVGTGNGQVALELAKHFKHVIATDASVDQIENAFQHERIDYRIEPAERTSITLQTVDLVTVGTAVHWFDFGAFYEEVRRVCKPNGVLAVWVYNLPTIEPQVDKLLDRFTNKILKPYWPERLHYLFEQYRALPFPFEEIIPPKFTMETEWNLDDLVGFLSSWSAIPIYLKAEGVHPVDKILTELQEGWGDPAKKKLVKWPLFFRIGEVQKKLDE
jgi:SAM-dependent methyltransferase